MASRDEVLHMLQEGLKTEKLAEENCDKLLEEFKLNGFAEMVEHIRNDEISHQIIVEKLIGLI